MKPAELCVRPIAAARKSEPLAEALRANPYERVEGERHEMVPACTAQGSLVFAALPLPLTGIASAQSHGHGADRKSAELTRIVREAADDENSSSALLDAAPR
jgi:hypothetical protein